MRYFLTAICIFLFSCSLHAYELSQQEIEFVKSLQVALESDNRNWISESVSYPLKVTTQNGAKIVSNKEELLNDFEFVFNCEIKKAVKQQDLNNIFSNWQGLMLGSDGQIWITTVEDDGGERSWIIAINH